MTILKRLIYNLFTVGEVLLEVNGGEGRAQKGEEQECLDHVDPAEECQSRSA